MEEKSVSNKVVFARKPANLGELQDGSWSECISASVVVERVVELSPARYARFAGNLLSDYEFLREHQNRMYVDTQGVWHCLLVKAQGAKDGILVNTEGAAFPRYTGYCPDVRSWLPREPKQESERRRGEPSPMSAEAARHRRLFLLTYDYIESGVTQRCGFLCQATTVREAAELFWNQHPGKWYHLKSVTDGKTEVFWVEQLGQFVTVPGRHHMRKADAAALSRLLLGFGGESSMSPPLPREGANEEAENTSSHTLTPGGRVRRQQQTRNMAAREKQK